MNTPKEPWKAEFERRLKTEDLVIRVGKTVVWFDRVDPEPTEDFADPLDIGCLPAHPPHKG